MKHKLKNKSNEKMNFFSKMFSDEASYKKVDKEEKFNFLLQKMMDNRWKITLLVLFTFFFIVFGIVMATLFKTSLDGAWKELLLILLGAFVGNLNKVIDFYFSSEDRDKMLIQKMDEEDGSSLSNTMTTTAD